MAASRGCVSMASRSAPSRPPAPDQLVDLVAMENGGRPVAWNDASFGSSVTSLLLPGRGTSMGDGWRPDGVASPATTGACSNSVPGHDRENRGRYRLLQGQLPRPLLAAGGLVSGGTDRSATTQSMFWQTLLPEQKLDMDALHTYTTEVANPAR